MEKGKYLGKHFPGSSLFGEQNKMFAPNSFCLGRNLETKNEGEVAIGKFNSSTKAAGANSGTVFSIGGGTAGTRKNLFEIKEDGSANLDGRDISHPATDYGFRVPGGRIIHSLLGEEPDPWDNDHIINNIEDFGASPVLFGGIIRFDFANKARELITELWPNAEFTIVAVWHQPTGEWTSDTIYVLLDGTDGTEESDTDYRLIEIEF